MRLQPKHSKIQTVKKLLTDTPDIQVHLDRLTDDEAHTFMDLLTRCRKTVVGANIDDLEDLKKHLSPVLTLEEIQIFQTLAIKLYSENYETH